ncbi:MAG: AAA family ATPase [Planctomycetes bacterium]|nr:AAA family ATPase [Planctomycetota bacterium]
MRLPNSKDLSDEQMEVYLEAPIEGDVLVTGPPGTGKTVIAMFRAGYLVKKRRSPTVVMFNSVLRNYTGNAAGGEFETSTLHSWANSWWENLDIPVDCVQPLSSVLVDCPADERPEINRLGGRYDFYKRKVRVRADAYELHRSKIRWPVVPAFPHGDSVLELNWRGALNAIANAYARAGLNPKSIDWGHLIVDEAQDFGNELWEMFRVIRQIMFKDNRGPVPALTVLADENQRIFENNSTIDEIRQGLSIAKEREYQLTRNYRNTKETAMLAREFYVGLETGIPKLPSRGGDKPKLVRAQSYNACIGYIARYARMHDNEEIGIILRKNSLVAQYAGILAEKLKDKKAIKVQAYASDIKEYKNARKLVFDKPGHITVVNRASCKGLEFDAVFIPELHSYSADDALQDQPKMDMYVMISRARNRVFLIYQGSPGSPIPQFVSKLPGPDSGLLEWCDA